MNTPSLHTEPHLHLTVDEFVSLEEIEEIHTSWPSEDWPGWVWYDGKYEGKKASDAATPIPEACSVLLAKVANYPIGRLLGMPQSIPDLSLWGGGLHEMPPGGMLDRHLDADTHPRLGLARAWSALLYVHREPILGGELVLLGEEPGVCRTIAATRGRLVAFDCRDAWHAVLPQVSYPHPRRALALFGYLPEQGPRKRLRAFFDCPEAAGR